MTTVEVREFFMRPGHKALAVAVFNWSAREGMVLKTIDFDGLLSGQEIKILADQAWEKIEKIYSPLILVGADKIDRKIK